MKAYECSMITSESRNIKVGDLGFAVGDLLRKQAWCSEP